MRTPYVALIWTLGLVALVISAAILARPTPRVAQSAGGHSQATLPFAASAADQDWSNSRYRCVVCHTNHTHAILMTHPLVQDCGGCHSGPATLVGCPTCHSMHVVDDNHETYPTCVECHEQELADLEPAAVQATATGFLAYMFNQREFFLTDDSALSKTP